MGDPLTFQSWMTSGLSSALPARADDSGLPPSAEAMIEAGLRLSNIPDPIMQTIALRGPGDVLRLEAGTITKCVPAPGARDCAPNFFPYVEFSEPELPWLYTPARPGPSDRLIPWLSLIAVEEGPGIVLSPLSDPPVMRLSIADGAGAILHPLDQAYAWAHLQDVPGPYGTRRVARLLCPAKLKPNAQYTICLVPSFEAGRLAGLGRAPETDGRLLSWEDGTGALDLPVYHHWRFSTGSADFEALVRRLFPFEADASLGLNDLDLRYPRGGLNLKDLDLGHRAEKAARVSFAGALTSPVAKRRDWDEQHQRPFKTALHNMLNAKVQKPGNRNSYSALEHDPVITPPTYGSWQAGPQPVEKPQPKWMDSANTDPAQRAVSGLGTRVVRKHQEEFMGRAWAMLAKHDQIDATLRHARVAMSVGTRVHSRLGDLEQADLIQITTPIHKAVKARPDKPASVAEALLSNAAIPDAVFSATFRKVSVRAAKAVTPKRAKPAPNPVELTAAVTSLCLSGQSQVLGDHYFSLTANVMAPPDVTVGGTTLRSGASIEMLAGQAKLPLDKGALAAVPGMTVPRITERVRPKTHIARSVAAPNLGDLKGRLLVETEPARLQQDRVFDRIGGLTPDMAPGFAIPRRVRAQIRFDEASYARLMRHDERMILPGAETIPEDAVSVVETNPAFVESYLLGLNHEMSREFAWRGFPTRLDATWFDTFWDYVDDPDARDIDPIATWRRDRPLGGGKAGPGRDAVVLLKSELFRRYPDTQVYLAPAEWRAPTKDEARAMDAVNRRQGQPEGEAIRTAILSKPLYPLFQGKIGPQISFFGFDIDTDELQGDPRPSKDAGWFVVFEQTVKEPQFGLDLPDRFSPDSAPRRADNLHWGHFSASLAEFEAMTFASTAPLWKDTPIQGARWGKTAAETARLAYQSPVRILFHASALIARRG